MSAINIYDNTNQTYTPDLFTNQNDPFTGKPSPNLGLSFPSSTRIKKSARKVSYQIATLGQTTHIYTSPSYDDMTDLARYFGDWSCNYEIQEGPTHVFTVTAPWDTMTEQDFNVSLYASEQWEVTEYESSKDLIEIGTIVNPYVPPSDTNNYVMLPMVVQVAIQKAVENKAFSINLSGSAYASYQPYAMETLNYKRRGVEGVPFYGQILKRTAVIDKKNTNNAFNTLADDYQQSLAKKGTVNFLYSTAGMLSKYSIPTDTVGKFMLKSYAKQISVPGVDPFTANVLAGWLVKPPRLQFITRNKVQLTQEFTWGEYLEGLFFVASPVSDFTQTMAPYTLA